MKTFQPFLFKYQPMKRKLDLIADVLIEAAHTTDVQAAEKYKVSARSIRRWRKELDKDGDLAAIVRLKKEKVEVGWAEEAGATMLDAVKYLRRASVAATVDAEMVYAVAGAFKVLNEALLAKALLDVRLSAVRGQDNPANR